jgi:uncharacterized protein (TIGR03437 family)
MGIGILQDPLAWLVANSGDNSVSAFSVPWSPAHQMLNGIPGPYGVAGCRGGALVSSPSNNAVWVLKAEVTTERGLQLSVAGRIPTGPQPHAVRCDNPYPDSAAVVSNVGDDTLTIVDRTQLKVRTTIPGVAGSRSLHGIDVTRRGSGADVTDLAWVAGTDASLVTVVDLSQARVVARIPVSRPTAVRRCSVLGSEAVCIASATGAVTVIDPATFSSVPGFQFPAPPGIEDFIPSLVVSSSDALENAYYFGAVITGASLWVVDGMADTPRTNPLLTLPSVAAVVAFGNAYGFFPRVVESYVSFTSPSIDRLITVYWAQRPPSTDFAATNAASFSRTPVAPGSLASVFVATGVTQDFKATSLPLPTTLGGVTLKVGGVLSYTPGSGLTFSPEGAVAVPLLFVGPQQINFQAPSGLSPAPYVQAQLTRPDGSTRLETISLNAFSPGIFSIAQNGLGQAAVLNQDFSQNGSPQILAGARPASRGEVIHIYATGAGETVPALQTGEAAPAGGNPLVFTKAQPVVGIGGRTAEVLFSGAAPGFVGLWQIDARIPQQVSPGSVIPLTIRIGNLTSNTVTIAVQ